jgi:hypothetical protein
MGGRSYFSSVFLELQLTILTLSARTVWLPLSSLKVTLRIRNVQTSSQKRYVSREPCVPSPSQPSPFSERMNRPDLARVFPSGHIPHQRIHPRAHGRSKHLKSQPGLDSLLQRLGNNAIELGQDLHGQLRVDPLVPDQLVQGIRQGDAETRQTRSAKRPLSMVRRRLALRPRAANLPSMTIQIVIVGC